MTPAAFRARALTNGADQSCDLALLNGVAFRSIGPAISGGCISAIAVTASHLSTFYVAGAGGIWKTTNNGTTWTSAFDHEGSATIGHLAVAPSNPDVIWAGTGDKWTFRRGHGMYHSPDAGRTWASVGLRDAYRIARVAVDPGDAAVCYVAVPGPLAGPSPNRGLYKTADTGRSWTKTLFINDVIGITDVAIDPSDRRTLIAAASSTRRLQDEYTTAGPGSGLYKSTDGGQSWRKLVAGLPRGDVRCAGFDRCQTKPHIVYALIEAPERGLFRSDDGAETWSQVKMPALRPSWFGDIKIDPHDEQRLYLLRERLCVSEDGGHTFRIDSGPACGPGVHTMWINPLNPDHLMIGTERGLHISYDRARTWQHCQNLSIADFSHLGLDMRTPYYAYGGSQSAGTWAGPSSTRESRGLVNHDWFPVAREPRVQVDPTDSHTVYAAGHNTLVRSDLRGSEHKSIHPDPPNADQPSLWPHTSVAFLISPHHRSTIYAGARRLFKSTDRGLTWTPLSRDLTAATSQRRLPSDREADAPGDPVARGRIGALAESSRTPGLLYAALDDGGVHVTRDGGKTWVNVSTKFRTLPRGTPAVCISASPHEANTAYVAFNGRYDDDYTAYVFMTTDAGRSWTSIGSHLQGPVNVVREDPRNPELLYAGTDGGLFVSLNRGGRWAQVRNNLPDVSVEDLLVHPRDNDLVVTTGGRGIWILDDVTPLQELPSAAAAIGPYLFGVRPGTQFVAHRSHVPFESGAFAAPNPPAGAIISYCLKESTTHPIRLIVSNTTDAVVRELAGTPERGVNRISWDLRRAPHRGPSSDPSGVAQWEDARLGAFVPRGEYRVTLFVGDEPHGSRAIQVDCDPLVEISDVARHEQQRAVNMLTTMQDSLSALASAVRTLWTEWRRRHEQFDIRTLPTDFLLVARAFVEVLSDLQRRVGLRIPTVDDDLNVHAFMAASAAGRRVPVGDGRPAVIATQQRTKSPQLALPTADAPMCSLRRRVQHLKAEIAASPSAPTAVQARAVQQLHDDVIRVMAHFSAVAVDRLAALNQLLEQHGARPIPLPVLPNVSDARGH